MSNFNKNIIIHSTCKFVELKSFILVLMLSLVIISCENKNNTDEVNTTNDQTNNVSNFSSVKGKNSQNSNLNASAQDIQINVANDLKVDAKEALVNTENGSRINPEVIKKLFPTSIGKYKLVTPSGGVMNFSGYSVTSSNATYSGDRGSLTIVIQDYGDNVNFPEKKQFEKLPVIAGMLVEKVNINNAVSYLVWDKGRNSGMINTLFYDRFIVKIDANEVLLDKDYIIAILNNIKINKLKEFTLIEKIKK